MARSETTSADLSAADPILETSGLSKYYGELAAVEDVDFSVQPGDFHSVIGPNGAGKTTLLDLITGGREPSSGRIIFQGTDITEESAHERLHRGLARSFQITTLFDDLSVRENLRVATQSLAYDDLGWFTSLFRDTSELEDIERRTDDILEELGLEDVATEPTHSLSYGDRRKLEIGVVLATEPEMVLLDEPTAGMSVDKTHETMEIIEQVLADATLVLVEHDVELVMEISDRITVLHRGSILSEGTPEEIANDPSVQEAYLGGTT